jgi:hypothetical protein
LGRGKRLTPTEEKVLEKVVDDAGYPWDMMPIPEVSNWWKITFSPVRRQMRQYLYDKTLYEFNPLFSRLSKKKTTQMTAAKNKILAKNPNYFTQFAQRPPVLWPIRTMAIAMRAAAKAGEFDDPRWTEDARQFAMAHAIKRQQEKAKWKNPTVKSQLNGSNGETTGKDDVSVMISENDFNTFLGEFNRAIRTVKEIKFTRLVVEHAVLRKMRLTKFQAEEQDLILSVCIALKNNQSFHCQVGKYYWVYYGNDVVMFTTNDCMSTELKFTNLHLVASDLNGNNGEVTGVDDHISPCTQKPCKQPKHYHPKKKPHSGAQRRVNEKVKICKPVKIEDLELCEELGCEKDHYHITASDRRKHAHITAVQESIRDEIEKQEGYADANVEIEDLHKLFTIPSRKKKVVMTSIDMLRNMLYIRYPQDDFPAATIIENWLRTKEAHDTLDWVTSLPTARKYLDQSMAMLLACGKVDIMGGEGDIKYYIPLVHPEKHDLLDDEEFVPLPHKLLVNEENSFQIKECMTDLFHHESLQELNQRLNFTAHQVKVVSDELEHENYSATTSSPSEGSSSTSELSNAPTDVECSNVVTNPLYANNPPISEGSILYSVGGWLQDSTRSPIYYKGNGTPVKSYQDLEMREVTFANRDFRFLKTFQELPAVCNGWWTALDQEKPYYYGKSAHTEFAVSLSLIEILRKHRSATIVTEAAINSTIYQAMMQTGYPSEISFPTVLWFLHEWTVMRAQIASLTRKNETFLKKQKVPMRVPLNLETSETLEMIRVHRQPAGLYHSDSLNPIHLNHIPSANFGDAADPMMTPNKRWRYRSSSGGASFEKGYIRFPSSWFRDSYESVYFAFGCMTGVIQPCSREMEKIILRLTMDKTGRDALMISLQEKAFNEPSARTWLLSMGDKRTYPSVTGWAVEFTSVYRQLLSAPLYNEGDWKTDILDYVMSIGIKVDQRIRVVEEIAADPHIHTKTYNEVSFKPDENQKIKYRDGVPIVSYARAFIALPNKEWAVAKPHQISRFKSVLSHTVVWNKMGMYSEDGFIPTPNPHDPWMHTTCLYPTYVDANKNTKVKVEVVHLALVVANSMTFVEETQGFASIAHGDDVWTCRYHPSEGMVFVESDIVSNDISHTQFAFAQTALALQSAGLYNADVFKQMQRDIRLRNGPFKKEWVQLEPVLGFNLPTGSVLTTPHNSFIAMVICFAMLVFGCDVAQDHVGYTLEMKKKYLLEQSTFLAHFFYESPDGQISGNHCVACSICPSVLFRGSFKTKGDFLGKAGIPVTTKGREHMQSVIKGMLVEDTNPIIAAFYTHLPLTYRTLNPLKVRSEESLRQYRAALVNRCENGAITDQDIDVLCERIRGAKYGSVIVDPVVDAVLLVRYGIPPSCV